MSDWDVDDVAGSTWSSLGEVAWIENENKIERLVPDSRSRRSSSCTSAEFVKKDVVESSEGERTLPDGNDQKLKKPNASQKSEALQERDTQEPEYSSIERTISTGKGDWYDCTPGSSVTALPLNNSGKSGSVPGGVREVEAKKEMAKYSFEGAEKCKVDSGYSEDGADIVNSSCHFLLSDMCPPGGDLEFLAEVQEEVRRDNLLEFGWGNTNNLEDMDRLFSSTDSILSRGFDNNTGMLWEPPSPTLGDSLDSLRQPVAVPVIPEFVKAEVGNGFEAKTELVISKSLVKQETLPVSEEWRNSGHDKQHISPKQHAVPANDSCIPMQVDSYTDCSNGNNWESQGATVGRNRGSECTDNESVHGQKEAIKWKTNKGKRHGPRSKKLEDNARKSAASGQKVALNLVQTNNSPLMYVPVVPIAQDSALTSAQLSRVSSCEQISPMQGLQPVSYVHAGFGFPTHHHLPVVVPTSAIMSQQLQPQGQPVFISYQPQYNEAPKLQPSKGTFDTSSQSPTASSTMTPQEKIEKLRWRQKMQARLAVEQQQQQLISQRLIPQQAPFVRPTAQLNNHEEVLGGSMRLAQSECGEAFGRSLSLEAAMIEDGDESLAAGVLHQLLNIASKMDTRTRLCLRDGFGRLARNAMQRRAIGDSRGFKRDSADLIHRSCTADSSSSSEQSCSQRLLTVDDIVETETNPMDRFIAHLLFHKRFSSSYTNLNLHQTPSNTSENSEAGAVHQNGWAWNEANQLAHLSPATRSSSVTGEVEISKGASAVSDVPTSDNNICAKAKTHSACASQPIVSGLQLEKVLNFSAVSTNNCLQHLVERDPDIAEMGPTVSTSAGHMNISDEFAEPQLEVK